jgi:hypothetical protein
MDPIAQVKLIPVILECGLELGVHPKIVKLFNLKPGQKIDSDTFKKIMRANSEMDQSG